MTRNDVLHYLALFPCFIYSLCCTFFWRKSYFPPTSSFWRHNTFVPHTSHLIDITRNEYCFTNQIYFLARFSHTLSIKCTRVNPCTHSHTCTCTHTHTHRRMYEHTYKHMYVHTHIYIHIPHVHTLWVHTYHYHHHTHMYDHSHTFIHLQMTINKPYVLYSSVLLFSLLTIVYLLYIVQSSSQTQHVSFPQGFSTLLIECRCDTYYYVYGHGIKSIHSIDCTMECITNELLTRRRT